MKTLFSTAGVAAAAGVMALAIAGSAQAKTVVINLSPVLGGTISGTTDLSANETVKYKFTVPVPYNFKFTFADGIAFTTSGQNGNYIETFTNGPVASTGSYTLATAVPEPASWALMLVGFGGLGAVARRRKALAAA